jgi:quercetin dioxygenase-like cupin family protein
VAEKGYTMVYWRMQADAQVAVRQHPQEQFVWVIKGAISLRIGTEERTIKPGDIAVVPGGVEHEALFPEDTEVIDFFAPVREDFLSGEVPPYMAQR